MQPPGRAQSLDGNDLAAVLDGRQSQTAVGTAPIDVDGAGSALAVIAALLGSSQVQNLAQTIEQAQARIYAKLPLLAIDHHRNGQQSVFLGRIRVLCAHWRCSERKDGQPSPQGYADTNSVSRLRASPAGLLPSFRQRCPCNGRPKPGFPHQRIVTSSDDLTSRLPDASAQIHCVRCVSRIAGRFKPGLAL
jgi:hypothetical protein